MSSEIAPQDAPSRQQIGIAVVAGRHGYLVGVRGPGTALAGKAEFPGGKCLAGEPPQACAVRECLEETGLGVRIERLLCEREYDYPHARVALFFYLCTPLDEPADAPLPLPAGWRWVESGELRELDFPAANAPVIERLLAARGPGELL